MNVGFGDSVFINSMSTEDHLESQIERLWHRDILPSSYGRQSLMSRGQVCFADDGKVKDHCQWSLPGVPGGTVVET